MRFSVLAASAVLTLASASASALAVEVLVNTGFETPVQVGSGNHIGSVPTGYTADAGSFNIVRDSGGGNSPRTGDQFLDLTGGTSFYQDFTLASASFVTFGGWFQGRDNADMGSGNTSIYDNLGNLLFSSPLLTLVDEQYALSSGTGNLAAGTYRFRVFMEEPTSVDDVFVRAEAVSSVPDGGATLALLGLTMTGMAWVRRKTVG